MGHRWIWKDGSWSSSAYPVDKTHTAAFEESALLQLEEMIRIHRNHPSIVAWSVCNEAFFRPGGYGWHARIVAGKW